MAIPVSVFGTGVAAWLAVLCLSAAAQLLTPSGLKVAGGATASPDVPTAWMRVTVRFPPVRDDASAHETTIELVRLVDGHERLVTSTEFRSPADLQPFLTGDRLTFHNVPTEQPVHLRISARGRDGTPRQIYSASYILHFPSGYLGDFVIDSVTGDVTRTWRDK